MYFIYRPSAFLLMMLFSFVIAGCSSITIKKPAKNEKRIESLTYDIRVEHEGCGRVKQKSFRAWLDKGTEEEQDISSKFNYINEAWIAEDYIFPIGPHTLNSSASVDTGAWCIKYKSSDEREFYVGNMYLDYAIEMEPPVLIISYDVPQFGTHSVRIENGGNATIYPGNRPILASYTLKNLTNDVMRFRVYFGYRNSYYDPQAVDLRGPSTAVVNHRVALPADTSGRVLIIVPEALVEPLGNDTTPLYFNATLQVREQFACPEGNECCEPHPDGSCGSCLPICP